MGEAGAATAENLTGRAFAGRYRVEDRVGKGGMSVVYRAVHLPTGRTVALKVLSPDVSGDEKQVLRFEQEAKASSRLRHPNIIRVFDYGRSDDGLLFIAMELLIGRTVGDLVRRDGPVSASRACRIIGQVCDALAAAHELGIIHRDLKPDNVFLPDGRPPPGVTIEGDFIKLLDFGIAKVVGEQGYETLTQTGFICGTPLYISPEQSLGMQLDGRADLYSVGVLLFELLAGRTPFVADSPIALVMKHIHNEPPKLVHVNPSVEVPKELRELVVSLLSKDRDGRPRSAREVSRRLAAIAAGCEDLPAATPIGRRAAPPPAPAPRPTLPPRPEMAADDRTRVDLERPAPAPMPVGRVRRKVSPLVWVSLAAALVVTGTLVFLTTMVPWDQPVGVVDASTTSDTPPERPDAERSGEAVGERASERPGPKPAAAHSPTASRAAAAPVARVAAAPSSAPRAPLVSTAQLPSDTVVAGMNASVRRESGDERQARRPLALEGGTVAAAPAATDAPSARAFMIESVPSGARVTVRGKPEGRTPYRFEADESTDSTTVIVSRRGYLPETWQYHPGAAPPPGQDRVKLVLKKRKTRVRKRIKWEE